MPSLPSKRCEGKTGLHGRTGKGQHGGRVGKRSKRGKIGEVRGVGRGVERVLGKEGAGILGSTREMRGAAHVRISSRQAA